MACVIMGAADGGAAEGRGLPGYHPSCAEHLVRGLRRNGKAYSRRYHDSWVLARPLADTLPAAIGRLSKVGLHIMISISLWQMTDNRQNVYQRPAMAASGWLGPRSRRDTCDTTLSFRSLCSGSPHHPARIRRQKSHSCPRYTTLLSVCVSDTRTHRRGPGRGSDSPRTSCPSPRWS
jgi:hypothetical protein